MSYILDALKRAERDRHAARVPTLATVHASAHPTRPRWPWLGGGVLLVNVIAIVVLLLRAGPVAGPTNTIESPAPPAAASPPAGSQKSVEPPATGRHIAPEPGASRSTAVAPAPVALVRPGRAPEGRAPQRSLAALKLEMVVNADDPAERAVYISGRRYLSGQSLESGAMIESIAPDSVVLRWAGHRYLLGWGRAPTPLGQ
ncbi:MAG TPA: general secretion pathway protein GspB [Methylomirabilota bacterium]|nr:general secretion pathway protein GspB [Methylomirabilota bacterium]